MLPDLRYAICGGHTRLGEGFSTHPYPTDCSGVQAHTTVAQRRTRRDGRGLGPPACEMAARAGAMAMRKKGQQVRRGLLASFRRSVLAFLTQHARSLGRARARAMLAGGEADSRRQSKTSKSND